MRGEFLVARGEDTVGPGLDHDSRFLNDHDATGGDVERRLPAADQFDIDFRQQLGVEQRAMLGAARIVDVEALAQCVERRCTMKMKLREKICVSETL